MMREHKLTARQVGDMLNRTPKTIRNWRSSADRPIPEHALTILRARIAALKGGA